MINHTSKNQALMDDEFHTHHIKLNASKSWQKYALVLLPISFLILTCWLIWHFHSNMAFSILIGISATYLTLMHATIALYNCMGEELIEIGNQELRITRQVVGIQYTQKYKIDQIGKITYSSVKWYDRNIGTNWSHYSIHKNLNYFVNHKLTFKYQSKEIKFGVDLNKEDAMKIIKEMNDDLDSKRKKTS